MGGTVAAKDDNGKRRGGGFRAAGAEAAGILSPIMRKRGFAHVEVIQRWPEIVGPTLADNCRPERLQWPRDESAGEGATLHMLVASGWAVEVQHLEPVIVERINRFFGWRAVTRLKLRQGPVRARPKRVLPKQRPLTEAEQAELDRLVAGVADPDVKATLRRLGASIMARESS
ncbi:MAG: DUF721 domain-containing protein [Minwuia sp.]|uniref:DUF721 domain-containing protein n=1 Tax=Minwuia sp. TaxID=2493630 RepID=UPI003A8B62EA